MEDIKINIIWKGEEKLQANANVLIYTIDLGKIHLKGFAIWKSRIFNNRIKDNINITPPTIMIYGNPFILVYFEEEECWYKLEEAIYEKFRLKRLKIMEKLDDFDFDIDDS